MVVKPAPWHTALSSKLVLNWARRCESHRMCVILPKTNSYISSLKKLVKKKILDASKSVASHRNVCMYVCMYCSF